MGDFPGGPVVKTSNAGDAGLIPGQGAEIQHASQPKSQNIKQKQYCNKLYKDFKNWSTLKKKKVLKKKPSSSPEKRNLSSYGCPVISLAISLNPVTVE